MSILNKKIHNMSNLEIEEKISLLELGEKLTNRISNDPKVKKIYTALLEEKNKRKED